MKIIWFCNVLLPEFSQAIGRPVQNFGGWLIEFKNGIAKDNNRLIICTFDFNIDHIIEKKVNNVTYYLLPKKEKNHIYYDESVERYIENVLRKEKPDIVHVWGSEYPHTLSVIKISNLLRIKSVISLQGIISDYAKHYNNGIPSKIVHSWTLRDFLRHDNLMQQQKKFEIRGKLEKESLQMVENVIGRTIYDYSCAKEINNNISYFFCNECLRKLFYQHRWDIDKIQKNSIFISQANYPIKGFHFFLDALYIVKKIYPDVKVYVAGGFNPIVSGKEKIKEGVYSRYIRNKINQLNLKNNIVFVGSLDELSMVKRMLKANVFVSPSLIENSPNSVGEAMLMGVPTISSFVGGVGDMLVHNKEGFLYAFNQPNVLASYIIKIFNDRELALTLSKNSQIHALKIFNREENINRMLSIYKEIIESNN